MASSQTIRQRKKDRVTELLEEDTLDQAEQEELLNEFSRLHCQDCKDWSVLWGVLGVFVALVYVTFATIELYNPYAAFSHIQLQGTLSSATIITAEMVSCGALCSVSLAMFLGMPSGLPKTLRKPATPHNRQRLCDQLLYGGGVAVSVAASMFWSIVIAVWLSQHPSTMGYVWRLLWLPLCPVSYALLTRHIIRGLEDTSAEIARLRGVMYEHHKA